MADAQVVVEAILDSSKVNKGVGNIKKSVAGINWNSLVEGDEKAKQLASGLKSAGATCTAAFTVPIVAAGAASLKMAMGFDDAMAKVSTIADTSQVPLSDLRKQILDLSDQTGISAAEIADNVYNAISAGQETGDAVNFVANAAKLATAGFATSADALDILSTAMNAYGLEASEVGHVSDILIQTQNKGKTTVAELSQSMGKAIPTAKAFNVNLENLAAAYATTTARGIATAESTTYINSMIKELGDTGSDVGKIIQKRLGVSFAEAMASGMSLGDALNVLNDEGAETGQTMYDMFGSAEAATAAATIASEGAAKFGENLAAMNDAAGLTDQAFEKMQTDTWSIEKAMNEVNNVMIELGETLLTAARPAIEDFINGTHGFVEWFKTLDSGGQQAIVTMGGVLAAIGPLLMALGKLVETVPKVVAGANAVKAALAGAAGLPTLLVGGLLALAGAYAVQTDAAMKAAAAEYELQGEQREAIDACTALVSSYQQMAEARDSQLEGISNEYGYMQELRAEYNGLIDENGQVKAGYEDRAEFILTTLASAMGIERDQIGGLVDANGQLGASIDEVLKKKQAEAALAANEQMYNEAIANRGRALQTLKSAQDVATQAEQRYQQAQSASKQVLETYNDILSRSPQEASAYIQANGDIIAAAEAAQQAYGESRQAVQDAEKAWVGYNVTVQNYEGLASAIISGDADEINQALLNMQEGFITAENGNRESLERQVENYRANLASLEQAINDGTPGVTQDMVNQASSMVTAAEAELAKLPGEASAKGTESGGQFASGVGSKSGDAASAGKSLATSAQGSMTADTYSSGANFGQGFINGIASTIGGAIAKAREMTQAALDAVRSTQSEGSPSKVTKKSGKFFTEGYAIGIQSKAELAKRAAAEMTQNAVNETLRAHYANEAARAGASLAKGAAKGVTANSDMLTQAIKGMMEDTTKKSEKKIVKSANALAANVAAAYRKLTKAGYDSYAEFEKQQKKWDKLVKKRDAQLKTLGLTWDKYSAKQAEWAKAVKKRDDTLEKSGYTWKKFVSDQRKWTEELKGDTSKWSESTKKSYERFKKVQEQMKGVWDESTQKGYESFQKLEDKLKVWDSKTQKSYAQFQKLANGIKASAKNITKYWDLAAVSLDLSAATKSATKNTKVLNNLYKRTGTVFSESFVEAFMNGGEEYQKVFAGMAKMTDKQVAAIVASFEGMERAERKEELSARKLAVQYREQMLVVGRSAKDAALDATEAALDMREALVSVKEEVAETTKTATDKTAAINRLVEMAGVTFTESFVAAILEGGDDYEKVLLKMATMTKKQIKELVESYSQMELAQRQEAVSEREWALSVRDSMATRAKSAEELALDVKEAVLGVREALAGNAGLKAALDTAGISADDLARMIGNLDVTVEDFANGVEAATQTVSDGFNRMARDSQTSLEDWKGNLLNNINEANEYALNLATVMNNIPNDIDSEAFRKAVYEGGYEKFGQMIADLATKSGEEIAEAIALYNESVTAGQQAAVASFESLAMEPPDIDELKKAANASKKAMGAVEDAAGQMEEAVSESLKQMETAASKTFKAVATMASDNMDEAVRAVEGGVSQMERTLRNANLAFPHIKIPHFSVRGDFSIDPPSVPTFSVNWYAKGGIFNGPSVVGVGERAPEMVLPKTGPMMDEFAERVAAKAGGGATVTVYIDRFENGSGEDIDELVDRVADAVDRKIAEKSRIKAYA